MTVSRWEGKGMSEQKLYQKLVRLAHANPDGIRKHLLPILKKQAALQATDQEKQDYINYLGLDRMPKGDFTPPETASRFLQSRGWKLERSPRKGARLLSKNYPDPDTWGSNHQPPLRVYAYMPAERHSIEGAVYFSVGTPNLTSREFGIPLQSYLLKQIDKEVHKVLVELRVNHQI